MAPTRKEARVAGAGRYSLGEGIIADPDGHRLLWVSILDGDVFTGHLSDGQVVETSRTHVDTFAGAVSTAADGGLLVAGARGLITISPEGAISTGPDLIPGLPHSRLNDGTVDPQGRYLVGSLALGERTDQEVVLRISPDGTVETLRTGVSLSNGFGFSPDGSLVYHVDTLVGTVASHVYPADGEWDVDGWVDIPCHFDELPDGMVVDANGDLWIAEWGGSHVRRHSPTGELLETIELSTRQPSCPGFVGDGLLAIITAGTGLTDPDAGAIFLVEVDAHGIPENRWQGNTTLPYWK